MQIQKKDKRGNYNYNDEQPPSSITGRIVGGQRSPLRLERDTGESGYGVDYVVMPQWKLFLVQLLNIAGLGPIFGAMQGAVGNILGVINMY